MSAEATARPARVSTVTAARSATSGLVRRVRSVVASGAWPELALAGVVFVCLLGARRSLFPLPSDDWTIALQHWWAYLQAHGFAGLGDEFANYNVPYLYVLWLGTALHADGLIWIKSVSTVADLALALGCGAMLRQLGASSRLALLGAIAVLLLPEVLLNSAAWGQADSIYAALLVWALAAALRHRTTATWVLLALALAFKMQAAFFLPAFAVLHLTRGWAWRGPVVAVGAFLLTEVPALVAGRSIASLAAVYAKQAAEPALLSMNAPTLFALLPEQYHDLLRGAGTWVALACVGLLSCVVLTRARRAPLSDRAAVLLTAAVGAVAVFALPMMHERYFYVADVVLFAVALVERRLLPWALAAQAVAFSTYAAYLFKVAPVVPLPVLAVAQGVIVAMMVRELLRMTLPTSTAATVDALVR